MLRQLADLDIAAADVVEVSPPFDVGGMTALAGATMMFELLCVMAGRGEPRGGGPPGGAGLAASALPVAAKTAVLSKMHQQERGPSPVAARWNRGSRAAGEGVWCR